jgi:hypothetical protein
LVSEIQEDVLVGVAQGRKEGGKNSRLEPGTKEQDQNEQSIKKEK